MSFWLRELAGWLLLGLGLLGFILVYDFLLQKKIVQAGTLSFVAFVIFRGGLHLLKVAMAARAVHEIPNSQSTSGPKRTFPTITPRVQPTDAQRAMPGPKPEITKGRG